MKKYTLGANRFFRQLSLAVVVLISRFNFLPANFSPLGSFGFFSRNFLLYFASIIIFDFIKSGFYEGFLFTYAGFFVYYLFGMFARRDINKQMLFLPLASVGFFLISNLGSWWLWYAHDTIGLAKCYLVALPFYRNTILGDLFFGYGYLLFVNRKSMIQSQSWQKIKTNLLSLATD